jgi:hypothetical protein
LRLAGRAFHGGNCRWSRILRQKNIRLVLREMEVSSDRIFAAIPAAWRASASAELLTLAEPLRTVAARLLYVGNGAKDALGGRPSGSTRHFS